MRNNQEKKQQKKKRREILEIHQEQENITRNSFILKQSWKTGSGRQKP